MGRQVSRMDGPRGGHHAKARSTSSPSCPGHARGLGLLPVAMLTDACLWQRGRKQMGDEWKDPADQGETYRGQPESWEAHMGGLEPRKLLTWVSCVRRTAECASTYYGYFCALMRGCGAKGGERGESRGVAVDGGDHRTSPSATHVSLKFWCSGVSGVIRAGQVHEVPDGAHQRDNRLWNRPLQAPR